MTSAPSAPMAVVVLLDVGWDETNKDIKLQLSLVDADGRAVTINGPFGEQPLTIEAQTQAGRPPGLKAGSDIRVPFTVNVGEGVPLEQNQRYEWRLTIDGKGHANWTAPFHTAPHH